MKKIKLTQGKYTLVDDEDFDFLNQWKWCYGSKGYAIRGIYGKRKENGLYKYKCIRMHRLIMNCSKDKQIDHINGNPLDNRRKNLRICIHIENCRNKKMRKDNKSKYKGVCWHKLHNKWISHLKLNKKTIHLGYFKNKKDAAFAYNKAAKKYFGEFALLNKI